MTDTLTVLEGLIAEGSTLKLIPIEVELLISMLETATEDEITPNDETATELAEENAGVLRSIVRLELILIDGELLISLLDITTNDKFTGDNETTEDLAESNTAVL